MEFNDNDNENVKLSFSIAMNLSSFADSENLVEKKRIEKERKKELEKEREKRSAEYYEDFNEKHFDDEQNGRRKPSKLKKVFETI